MDRRSSCPEALSASFSHAGHQDDRELGLEPIKHTARRLKAFCGNWGRWPRRKIARLAVAGAKSPKTGGRSPQTGAKTPERRKRPIFAPWPQNGETLDRATRKHAASQTNAFLGILRAPPACKIDSGTKKTPPEGIRTAPLTSSNCPRGKTVCLDKAARRVGAGREDGKRKKAPQRKKPRGRWSVRSRVWAEPWRRAIVGVISLREERREEHKIANLTWKDTIMFNVSVGNLFWDASRKRRTTICIYVIIATRETTM